MRLITLDFETYWSQTFSLTKMSPLEYVTSPEFELISCAIKVDNYPTDVFFGEEAIRTAFDRVADTVQGGMIVAHNNSGFDSYVLAYHLGLSPRMWGCTLAMARPFFAKTCGLSLGALVKQLGIGVKDNTALMNTKGKRLADFTPGELKDMAKYNRDDTDQCHALFHKLRPLFKASELWQIDALIRMRTEPQFELDTPMLETAASIERTRKHAALLELAKTLRTGGSVAVDLDWSDEPAVVEFVRGELASAARFSQLLTGLGVDVPTKPSPTNPEKIVPALAKTDEAFLALQEHDNPLVAAAARARLDVKSTLLETRIQKFLTAGERAGGMLPVPLRYCGADTTGRDSGEEYNPQNLPRINPDKPANSDCLRKSLRTPKGKMVIVADQSGIELRVNHFLWKVEESMALFAADRAKADLYKAFASDLYGAPVNGIDKAQRRIGKLAQLGLGFGAGAATFQRIAKVIGGVDIPVHAVADELSADAVVRAWRTKYHAIAGGWRRCGVALENIAAGKEAAIDDWGLLHTSKRGIVLPSGRLIYYPQLRQEEDGTWPDGRAKRSWMYAAGRHKAFLTGPKTTENCVQALARDSIFDCAVEYFKRTNLRPALRVHDELVYVVEEAKAQELLDELQHVMRTPPKWWPQLLVWSEGDTARTYGDAK